MRQGNKSKSLITEHEVIEQEYVRKAFELAYFIHADADIALRVTEQALCKLEHTFGVQGRRSYYVPGGRRQSRGGPAYALRTKVTLRKGHLLQLLIYAESDSWERYHEQSEGPNQPTNEDMLIRFIKHLVRITLKRNSFYVGLGIGRLLHEYNTSQVRQMYDVLMQDHARFRDNSYLRKQKKVLMEEMSERFDNMIRVVRTPEGEDRFLTQPSTQALINLVRECLHRYTPWGTVCVLPDNLDPAAEIPGLSFLSGDPDKESPIETNRIHAILDPDCFSRLVGSLGLESPDRRLAIPQFFFSDNRRPRGDRFNPPQLTPDDQRKLRRAREDSARRRKEYYGGPLQIYIDDAQSGSFDSRRISKWSVKFRPGANVIEIRGIDAHGELPLATLLTAFEDIPTGESLTDSIVLEGGQKLTIILTPIRNTSGETEEINLELRLTQTRLIQALLLWAQRVRFFLAEKVSGHSETQQLRPDYSWALKPALIMTLLLGGILILVVLWYRSQPTLNILPTPEQAQLSPAPVTPSPSMTSSPSQVRPAPEQAPLSLFARVTWVNDSERATDAVRIQGRRGDPPTVQIPRSRASLLIALNRADAEDRTYRRYRFLLLAAEEPFWENTVRAPQIRSSPAHLLKFELFPQRFPKGDSFKLRVEGETQAGWQTVGDLMLQFRSQ